MTSNGHLHDIGSRKRLMKKLNSNFTLSYNYDCHPSHIKFSFQRNVPLFFTLCQYFLHFQGFISPHICIYIVSFHFVILHFPSDQFVFLCSIPSLCIFVFSQVPVPETESLMLLKKKEKDQYHC